MIWLTVFLTLGAAVWLGAMTNQEWGFLVGGALGHLVAQRLRFGAEIAALRQRLAGLEAAPGAAPAAGPVAPRAPAAPPAPTPRVEPAAPAPAMPAVEPTPVAMATRGPA